jgi:FkbM family methyltransferase
VHEEIGAVYRRLLGRDPNEHEVLHWTTMAGEEMDYVVDSIMTSPEYQQKTSAQQKVLVELERFKIYVMENDLDVGRNLLKTSVHEPHITRVFADTLKGGDVFLDLGANLGYFSLLAATLVGKSGKVIAFEPNGQNLQLLYSSIIENQFENIKVHPVAASDSPQILKLTSFGSNGYLEAAPIGNSNFQLVQAVVADELLDSEPRLDMVKMDIEGYETLALRGLDRTIKKHKPVIITEFSPWHIKHRCGVDPQGYLMQISEYGYNLSMIEPSGTIRSASSAESLMDYWHSFNSETQHLDLIAHPV